MPRAIRVFLVDDHEMARHGLRRMLELDPGLEVVGEASDAEEALAQVPQFSPDIILMDIKMPNINGLEATRRLKERQIPGEVIMLSLYEEYMGQALEMGASGYLIKDVKQPELVSAIRRVFQGETVVGGGLLQTPYVVEQALAQLRKMIRVTPSEDPEPSDEPKASTGEPAENTQPRATQDEPNLSTTPIVGEVGMLEAESLEPPGPLPTPPVTPQASVNIIEQRGNIQPNGYTPRTGHSAIGANGVYPLPGQPPDITPGSTPALDEAPGQSNQDYQEQEGRPEILVQSQSWPAASGSLPAADIETWSAQPQELEVGEVMPQEETQAVPLDDSLMGLPQESGALGGAADLSERTELELFIAPPVEAGRLIAFYRRLEQVVGGEVTQSIGSWEEGASISLALRRPFPMIEILEEIPEVAEARLEKRDDPSKDEASYRIYVSLKEASEPKQLSMGMDDDAS